MCVVYVGGGVSEREERGERERERETLKFEHRVMERTLGVNAHLMRTTKFLLRGSFRSNTG